MNLKNKRIGSCDLNYASHGTCSYSCMYVNAVTNCVTLQLHLRHGF
jgi:hypothetical protein